MSRKLKDRASTQKITRATSTQSEKVAFSFEYLQSDYCFSLLPKESLNCFANRIKTLSSLTWLEINNSNRHSVGTEIISQDSIKSSIPKHITKDTNILAFRFHGKAPMLGYRSNNIFYLIWIDDNFKLYNH